MPTVEPIKNRGKNVLGQPLDICGCEPIPASTALDAARPAQTTTRPHHLLSRRRAFLEASKALGNDLSTPMPQFGFAGLKPGDRWCVCAARWLQVQQAGAGLSHHPRSHHENTLKIVPFELLIQ